MFPRWTMALCTAHSVQNHVEQLKAFSDLRLIEEISRPFFSFSVQLSRRRSAAHLVDGFFYLRPTAWVFDPLSFSFPIVNATFLMVEQLCVSVEDEVSRDLVSTQNAFVYFFDRRQTRIVSKKGNVSLSTHLLFVFSRSTRSHERLFKHISSIALSIHRNRFCPWGFLCQSRSKEPLHREEKKRKGNENTTNFFFFDWFEKERERIDFLLTNIISLALACAYVMKR